MLTTGIREHEGRKYLRTIRPATGAEQSIEIDVYCVLVAFAVTCPATAHAVKKLLCGGLRGKGDRLADLAGAKAAIERAMQLEMQANPVAGVNEP